MDKLDQLENAAARGAIAEMILASHDADAEVRLVAAEVMADYYHVADVSKRMRELCCDSDDLVRVEAIVAAGAAGDLHAKTLLRLALDDGEWLVRGEAAISLAKLGDFESSDRIRWLSNECGSEERIRYLVALSIFKDSAALESLLGYLSSDEYREVCAAANYLADSLSFVDRDVVLLALNGVDTSTLSVASRSSIEHAIQVFQETRKEKGSE